MDPSQFYKDPPAMILELMKDTFGDRFSQYYLGSPIEIPEAAYPCLIVQSIQSSNSISNAPTQTDSVGELIHIHFLENAKDYANISDDTQTVVRKLYQDIQGRDPSSGFYLAGTAMYALRTNISLYNGQVNTVIDQDIAIDYDILPRGELPTVTQAMITIVTRERVIVPNRV